MKLVEGYAFAAFYLLRIPLLIALGLAPAIIVRLTQTVFTTYYFCGLYSNSCQPPDSGVVLTSFLSYCVGIVAVFGVLAFGIALGTALALWWRNRYAAGWVATICVVSLIVFSIGLISRLPTTDDPITALAVAFLYTVLLYAVAIGIMLAAQPVARRRH